MMIELEAIFGSNLVTIVFLYGSAAMMVSSMAAVLWLCESRQPRLVLRPQATAKGLS
jgi:hypothetical protein